MTTVYNEHLEDVVLYFCRIKSDQWYFIDFRIKDYPLSAYVWDEQGKVNRIVVRIPSERMRQMFTSIDGSETDQLIETMTERGNGSLEAVLRWYCLQKPERKKKG